jgi:hypothetical protein
MRQNSLGAILLGLMVIVPQPAFPWGDEGHRIVAHVAEHRLHKDAAERVRDLIGPEGLASVSMWADEIKAERPETRPWHYVNIPLGQGGYDPGRDCATPQPGDCVIGALERMYARLVDSSTDAPAKVEALKFLVHLMGDLHQPLHFVDNRDRGGNEALVTFFGEQNIPFTNIPWNLHAVWDTALIHHAGLTQDQYVAKVEGLLKSRKPGDFEKGSFREWALETHRAAVEVAYGLLPPDRAIGEDYYRRALPVVDVMLAKGGARLGKILNEAFAPAR